MCLQTILTRLSGKPLDQEAPRSPGPYSILTGIALKLMVGLGLSVAAVAFAGWWWLLAVPGTVLTASAFRHLALTVMHETAGHDEVFTRNKAIDRCIGTTAAVLSISQNYQSYKEEHKLHHAKVMSDQDPTIRFLIDVLGTIFAPWYQVRQTFGRVSSSWSGASRMHRYGMVLHLVLVVGLVSMFPVAVMIAWLFPLIVVTNSAIGIRMCLEHVYPPAPTEKLRSPNGVEGSTHAVFFGTASPSCALSWYFQIPAWCMWVIGMVGFSVPCKLLLAPGESSAHDYHHVKPLAGAVPDPIYARQQYLIARSPDAPPLTEVWGAVPAIDDLFASLTESVAV